MNKVKIIALIVCTLTLAAALVYTFKDIAGSGILPQATPDDLAVKSPPAGKIVYYIAAEMANRAEYALAMNVRYRVYQNTNFSFKILDCAGSAENQREAMRNAENTAALMIVMPIDGSAPQCPAPVLELTGASKALEIGDDKRIAHAVYDAAMDMINKADKRRKLDLEETP